MTKLINDYSIKYHKKRLSNFWNKWSGQGKHYRRITWWIACMDLNPMNAGKEAKSLIKDFVRMAVIEKKISVDEASRLWDMIKSPDQDNQYIALSILAQYYPYAFTKEKSRL